MRLSDVDKVYKKLEPIQAATLAFEANIQRNTDEMIAIRDSQPQQYFVGASTAFRNRFMSLTHLGLFYGVVYWKNWAILMQRAAAYDDPGVIKNATILGSMEQALVQTCAQLGVNIESVKKLGEIEEDSFGEYAEDALTAEYLELFVGFM